MITLFFLQDISNADRPKLQYQGGKLTVQSKQQKLQMFKVGYPLLVSDLRPVQRWKVVCNYGIYAQKVARAIYTRGHCLLNFIYHRY